MSADRLPGRSRRIRGSWVLGLSLFSAVASVAALVGSRTALAIPNGCGACYSLVSNRCVREPDCPNGGGGTADPGGGGGSGGSGGGSSGGGGGGTPPAPGGGSSPGSGSGGSTGSSTQPPSISGPIEAMACTGSSSDAADCQCSVGGGSDSVVCGQSELFSNVQLQSLATSVDMVQRAKLNTKSANELLSSANTARGSSGSGSGNAIGGGGALGSGFGDLKTSAAPADGDGKNAGIGTGINGAFASGGGGGLDGAGGSGSRDDGGEGRADGGHSVVDLAATAGGVAGAMNGEGATAGGTRPGFDPDNSDTWTAEERIERLNAALEMDPDKYFAMIPGKKSIFEIVHERYQKVHKRWEPELAARMPASLATKEKAKLK